jgi:hypothetical protein
VSTHRVSALESRYRRLLRAYPAAYRRERGEEILCTLLEAAQDGRAQPLRRDAPALILSGLRVRAAQNRPLRAAACLRLAALLGIALWLSIGAASALAQALLDWLWMQPGGPLLLPWPVSGMAVGGVLTLTAVAATWLAPRTLGAYVSLAAAASWVPLLAIAWRTPTAMGLLLRVAALAILPVLALGRERPPRAWLGWVGAAACLLQGTYPAVLVTTQFSLEMTLAMAVAAWLVVDARPAMAVAVAAGLTGLATYGFALMDDPYAVAWRAPFLARVLALAGLALLAVRQLRRQAAL